MSKVPLKASDDPGGYIPTEEEKKKVRKVAGRFLLSGDGVFHTIQGEGNRAGIPTTFIRLHLCNLSCDWCDAYYTWKKDSKEYYTEPKSVTPEELYTLIQEAQKEKGLTKMCTNLTFTGGEPLLHIKEIEEFLKAYPEFTAQIETNGTVPPSEYLLERADFNCSPKIDSSDSDGKTIAVRYREAIVKKIADAKDTNIFKFVCSSSEDLDEVEKKFGHLLPLLQIYIMPEGVTCDENVVVFENIIDDIMSRGMCVAIRGQNVMFD